MTHGSIPKPIPFPFSPQFVHPSRGTLDPRAECVYDPELHTGPAGAESPMERAARQEVAREVCATCPLLPRCLAYALAAAPTAGVWAARTAQELTAADVLAEVA